MKPPIYSIHKGVTNPIEFKGLQEQYIIWLCIGLLGLLLGFVLLRIAGMPAIGCFIIIGIAAGLLFHLVYSMNRRYGQYGLMKKRAAKKLPTTIVISSRQIFKTKK